MSVLQVLTFPDDRLRTVAKPVESVTPEIQTIVDDMLETMYDEEGIGLAATQVDIHQRIVVIDISDSREEPMVLINPEIIEKRGEDGIEEGCLSVPGARALVPHAPHIVSQASCASRALHGPLVLGGAWCAGSLCHFMFRLTCARSRQLLKRPCG